MEQSRVMTAHITWVGAEEIHARASELMLPASVVLDIGCGIRPQRFVQADFQICLEPSAEYLSFLKACTPGANLVGLPFSALQGLEFLGDKSVDSVFLVDVLEHMPRQVGEAVIAQCSRVARKQIIIFTPLGFMPQEVHAGEPDAWGMAGGELQQHKSGWNPEDFESWDVVACKDFHRVDHRGTEIDPPYGAFYAIKTLPTVGNFFNIDYANRVVDAFQNHPGLTPELREFVLHAVDRSLAQARNRVGMLTCQHAAEKVSIHGSPEGVQLTREGLASIRDHFSQVESRVFIEGIKTLANHLSELKIQKDPIALAQRQADLNAREQKIAESEEALGRREEILHEHAKQLEIRKQWVESKEAILAAHEQELQKLYPKHR
jgi:hypothetical protein